MRLFDVLRCKLFWAVDFFRGGAISKHYVEIKELFENHHSEKSTEKRNRYLNDLLSHAVKTVPFYKAAGEYTDLKDFPVINKNIIKENFDDFSSVTFKDKEKYTVSSSGSTGTPFKLYQDKNKRSRNVTDAVFFARITDFEIGNKLFYLRVWSGNHKKSPFLAWMQNVTKQDITNFKDDELQNFILKLKQSKGRTGILSYASALEAIPKYLDKIKSEPIKCNLISVIANSESLSDYTKQSFKKYFNVSVVSRYSNNENGIIAQQMPNGNDDFLINWASYHVEILKFDEDSPVEYGQTGRVVVTDLFNYAMPIIRYDVGDVASMNINEDGIPVLKTVEGRRLDQIFNVDKEWVSSFIVTNTMSKFNELIQYQFLQEGEKEYELRLNTRGKLFERENILVSRFSEILGKDAIIKVTYVDEIPLLASGKRRQVVNNYTSGLN